MLVLPECSDAQPEALEIGALFPRLRGTPMNRRVVVYTGSSTQRARGASGDIAVGPDVRARLLLERPSLVEDEVVGISTTRAAEALGGRY